MKQTIAVALISSGLFISTPGLARDVNVELTNLTNGVYFTPLLVAAHSQNYHLFEVGTAASPSLQAMAEGGDLSGLILEVETAGGDYVANPAAGLLAPGATTTAQLELEELPHTGLSIVGMLLPTNDGFVGVDALPVPTKAGTYTYYLNGYDAGTEANDEIINGGGAPGVAGVPVDPGGNGGTGATGAAGADHNTTVHVHRGVLGDTDPVGGPSDLDSRVHRWLNPVAKLVLTIN
jgi:hypothetical protein